MINITQLSISLGGRQILQDIGFEIPTKSLIAIMGPSGCGKSTLLKALMGLEKCSSGSLHIEGRAPIPLAQWTLKQTTFGLVPQLPLLLPWKNALANILTAAPTDMNPSDANEQALRFLDRVGLREAEKLFPWQLSQGMAARVSLVRTLMMKSDVLLLDEPFAAIDATTRFHLQKWLLELVESFGQTALLVTHDPREALFLADKILVLNGKPATLSRTFELPSRTNRADSDWIFSSEAGHLEKELRSALE